MTPESLSQLIKKELQASAIRKDIESFLISPHEQNFEDMSGRTLKLWSVFKKDEYIIVYDETRSSFGLAFRNIMNELIYIGPQGGFLDAYDSLISRNEE